MRWRLRGWNSFGVFFGCSAHKTSNYRCYIRGSLAHSATFLCVAGKAVGSPFPQSFGDGPVPESMRGGSGAGGVGGTEEFRRVVPVH